MLLGACVLALGGCNPPTPPRANRDAGHALPAPERPGDLVAVAHFGSPQATVTAAGNVLGTAIPFQIALAVLGFDSTVLAASDLTQPIDLAVVGSGEHPDLLVSLTPGALSAFRPTLSGRYRFTPMPDVGERLDARSGTGEGLHCAVVGVPGPLAARIVCATRVEALAHAARFLAFESQRRAAEHTDLVVDASGPAARALVVSNVEPPLEDLVRSLAETAADARRHHVEAPALGDPEAVVAIANGAVHTIPRIADDLGDLSLRAQFDPGALDVDVRLGIAANGRSPLASDARARLDAATAHPLAASLASDSFAALASRCDPHARVTALDDAIDAALQVLGPRVSDSTAARSDLQALVGASDDALAVGVVREADGGNEVTILVGQSDGGTSARGALAALARARWLHGLHLGDAALDVSFANGVLSVRVPARPAALSRDAGTPETSAPRELAITVAGTTLALVLGSTARGSLSALAARAGGPAPGLLAHATAASLMFAVDLAAAAGLSGTRPIVSGAYDVSRNPSGLEAHLQLALPLDAMRVLRASRPAPRPR
jgi:hypothetical protein